MLGRAVIGIAVVVVAAILPTADMILADDNVVTIVATIREGAASSR